MANPNLTQHIEFYLYEYSPYRQFILAPIGSWNYDCADEYSDTDTKAIVLPSIQDVIQNKCDSFTHRFPNEEHFDATDIRNFLKSLQKGNPQFVEVLFSKWIYPNEAFYGKEIYELLKMREDIARCDAANTMRAFLGMADRNYRLSQDRFYEDHLSKWVYQLVRIEECMKKYSNDYSFTDCLITNQREDLLDIKHSTHYTKERLLKVAEASINTCKNVYEVYTAYQTHEKNKWIQHVLYELVKDVCKKSISEVD